MKRLKINVNGWFAHFKQLPPNDGYLPDRGVTSLIVDPSEMFDFKPTPENLGDQCDLNAVGYSGVRHHYLNSVAVCFWKGATCWSCSATYAVHSIIAKNTLASCDVSIKAAVQPSSEKELSLKPLVNIEAHETDFCVLPFGMEHLDKMVANTWQRLVHLKRVKPRPSGRGGRAPPGEARRIL